MNSETRLHFRLCLLQQLNAAHPVKLFAERLHTGARLAGYQVELIEVRGELADLADEKYVEGEPDPVVRERTLYRRTESGRALLASQGLA